MRRARDHLLLFLAACAVIVVGTSVIGTAGRVVSEWTPIERWITVETFHVESGPDPLVTFERTVERNLVGTWVMEVHLADGGPQVCSGEGTALYRVDEPGALSLPLTAYAGPRCAVLRSACYVLSGIIELRDTTGTLKVLDLRSNAFCVV